MDAQLASSAQIINSVSFVILSTILALVVSVRVSARNFVSSFTALFGYSCCNIAAYRAVTCGINLGLQSQPTGYVNLPAQYREDSSCLRRQEGWKVLPFWANRDA